MNQRDEALWQLRKARVGLSLVTASLTAVVSNGGHREVPRPAQEVAARPGETRRITRQAGESLGEVAEKLAKLAGAPATTQGRVIR